MTAIMEMFVAIIFLTVLTFNGGQIEIVSADRTGILIILEFLR